MPVDWLQVIRHLIFSVCFQYAFRPQFVTAFLVINPVSESGNEFFNKPSVYRFHVQVQMAWSLPRNFQFERTHQTSCSWKVDMVEEISQIFELTKIHLWKLKVTTWRCTAWLLLFKSGENLQLDLEDLKNLRLAKISPKF